MVNQDSSTIVVDYLWVRYQNTSILFVQFYYKEVGFKSFAINKTWSSGYGRRLAFKRLRDRIPAPDTRPTFFHIDLLKNVCCLKRPKIKEKEAGDGPFKKQVRKRRKNLEDKSFADTAALGVKILKSVISS